MNIIGYHCNGKILANSNGKWTDKPPYLGLILEDKDTDILQVFYDIDGDVACIFSNIELPEQFGQKLYNDEIVYFNECKITYYPSRLFGIDYNAGNLSASLSDTKQYRKFDDTVIEENETLEQIIEKAKIARDTARKIYGSMTKLGLHPTKLISPINTYEKEVMEKLNLSTYTDYPKEVNELAAQCCEGNWVETYKIGHFDKVYDYDINGAYPYQLMQLLDIRNGSWVKSNEYQPNATYGYCKCKIKINKDFSPLIYQMEDKTSMFGIENYTPTGSFTKVLNKKAIDFIKEYNLCEIEILDGQWFFKNSNKLPLSSEIKRLYDFKINGDEVDREVAKRLYSGIYGKTLERYQMKSGNWRYGKFCNYVYAAEVEMNTKIKIAKICMDNNIIPLYINCDGFITDKKIENIKIGNELGDWKLSKNGRCFIIGTGIATIEDNSNSNMYNISDLILKYDWLRKNIEDKPDETKYVMSKNIVVNLSMAMTTNKWEELGKVIKIERKIELGQYEKRSYRKLPKNGRELMNNIYESEPLDVSMLKIGNEIGV